MKFQRLKDRPAVVHPESSGERVTNGPERQKKYRQITIETVDWEDKNLPPAHITMSLQGTQRIRKERTHVSYEITNRKETAPCIEDLLKYREKYLKEQAREAMLEKRRQRQEEQMSKLELALEGGGSGDDLIEEDPVTANSDDEDMSEEEFKKRALLMKEKKITATRGSRTHHRHLTAWRRLALSISIYWFKNQIKREKCSQILPWLFLGDKLTAGNMTFLIGQGFTHIMNVTKEVGDKR